MFKQGVPGCGFLCWLREVEMTIDLGLSGGGLARRTSQLRAVRRGLAHGVLLQWSLRELAVHLDDVLLSRATVLTTPFMSGRI